ncbi:MAG: hypothetical protein ACXVL8_04075 [Acidimicrobiia bacterium]
MNQSPQIEPHVTRPSPYSVAGAIVVVAVFAVAIPYVIAHHYGATGIPRDDDWSYLRALFHWIDTGRLDFNNWVSMILLGQLVIAAPIVEIFGRDITAVQVLTAALGLIGLLAVLWLGTLVTGKLWLATFVAVLVALGPLWGELSVSFMTDIPAFTFTMLACAFGARAVSRPRISLAYLIAALAAAFVAFTIRQYAVVPLVAVALVGTWTLGRERSDRRWWAFVLVVAGFAAAAVVVFAYWRTIPNLKAFEPSFPDGHSIRVTLYKGTGMLRLTGLLLTPAIVLAGPVRIVRRAWAASNGVTIVLGAGALAVLTYTALAAPRIALAGNFVVPNGILANAVIGGTPRHDILPTGGWTLLLVIGTVAAILLVWAFVPTLMDLVHRASERDVAPGDSVVVLLGLVIAGYSSAYALAAFFGVPLSDRYVLPVVPLIGVLLLRRAGEVEVVEPRATRGHHRERLALAIGALFVLGLVGLVYTLDSASFDGARWKVGVAATRAGWAPNQISGSFEWTNFYEPGPHGTHRHRPTCVSVLLDPHSGVHAKNVIAFEYYRSPFRDAVPVVAIRTKEPCTPKRG